MATSALDQLEEFYLQIFDLLPREFDTHEFILKLAHQQQRAYAKALASYADSSKPFMLLHGEIARRLLRHSPHIQRVGEHNSADIFQQVNSAVIWRKQG